jgi:hypothetical protein
MSIRSELPILTVIYAHTALEKSPTIVFALREIVG